METVKTDWTQEMFSELKSKGKISLRDFSQRRFGNEERKNVRCMYSLFNNHRYIWAKELGKEVFLQNGMISSGVRPLDSLRKPRVHKDKTAVFIIREKTVTGNTAYDIEMLGEPNRNMAKEVLKQLMEAFV
jgi:hypothetical protein